MIDYSNMMPGQSKLSFRMRYLMNIVRTWYKFHVKYPWVEYHGFVRVRHHARFEKGMEVTIGNNVQFGPYCEVCCNAEFGNNVLMASRVSFIGKCDHSFDEPGKTIWQGIRDNSKKVVVEDDVLIGTGAIIFSGVTLHSGCIVAAGAIVTKDIPACEIWGGNPARKIRDRFSEEDKLRHLEAIKK